MNYKGDLEGFPDEVVEKMLERQVEQGNKRNVASFEERNSINFMDGGFDWSNTIEKWGFWWEVIIYKNFDLFFEKYPKKDKTIKYFEVGKMYNCAVWGEMECVKTDDTNIYYPVVCIRSNGDRIGYTFDGRYDKNSKITLSQNHIPEIVNKPIVEHKFKVGDFVSSPEYGNGLVSSIDDESIIVAHRYNNLVRYSISYKELKKLTVC